MGSRSKILRIGGHIRKLQVQTYLLMGMRLGLEATSDIKNEPPFYVAAHQQQRALSLSKMKISANGHHQIVGLGLKFRLNASKPQNMPSQGQQYQFLCQDPEQKKLRMPVSKVPSDHKHAPPPKPTISGVHSQISGLPQKTKRSP